MSSKQTSGSVWTTRQLAEAAAEGGRPVTQDYLGQLCKRGVIPAMRPSRDWLIQEADAREWLESWQAAKD